MRPRTTPGGLIAEDTARGRWARLPEEGDVLSFLSGGREAVARAQAALADAETADPADAVLPFRPRSIRAFMLWEQHVIASSRMLVKDFFPAPAAKVMLGYERITGKPFPKLKPNAKVSDGSQPPLTFDLSLSETAGSRSLDHLVRHSTLRVSSEPSWFVTTRS